MHRLSQPICFPHEPLDMISVDRFFKTAFGYGKTRLDPDIFGEVGLKGVKGQKGLFGSPFNPRDSHHPALIPGRFIQQVHTYRFRRHGRGLMVDPSSLDPPGPSVSWRGVSSFCVSGVS